MSSSTYPQLDLDEQIARIRQMQAESDKFAAEQRKLSQEAFKLTQEGMKLQRERFLAPFAVLAALGGLGGLITLVQWFGRIGGHQ